MTKACTYKANARILVPRFRTPIIILQMEKSSGNRSSACDCSQELQPQHCFQSFQGPCVKLPYNALGGGVGSRRIIRSKTLQIMFSLEIHAFKAKTDSQSISLLILAVLL